jgi:hypothetical protein
MGGKQPAFSDCELTTAKKQTKRQEFLSEMELNVLAELSNLFLTGR